MATTLSKIAAIISNKAASLEIFVRMLANIAVIFRKVVTVISIIVALLEISAVHFE
jgi:hypothetical protein